MSKTTPIRSAFITGATGCIGSALAARLAKENWQVVALVRDQTKADFLKELPRIKIVEGDLSNRERLIAAMKDCQTVFHLAAKVHAAPGTPAAEFVSVNVEGTRNVVVAAIQAGASSFVHFSTVAVYGESDQIFDETSVTKPTTAYGVSKLEAERIAFELTATEPLKTTALRLPVVYGAHDRGNVSKLIQAIQRGRYFIVGDGQNLKSMVAVENVVDAALLVAEAEKTGGQIYLVADASNYSQSEIAETIAELLGRPKPVRLPRWPLMLAGQMADAISKLAGVNLPISADRIRKLSSNTRCNAAKIEQELGFKPRVNLREGLAETINTDFKLRPL